MTELMKYWEGSISVNRLNEAARNADDMELLGPHAHEHEWVVQSLINFIN